MPTFAGEYRHNLDQNNRLAIPSRFHTLGEEFLVYKPLTGEKCLQLYSLADWHDAVEKACESKNENLRGTFRRMIHMNVDAAKLDKQGRITLAKEYCDFAGLGKEVVILGVDWYVEIWSKENYQKLTEESSRKLSEAGFDTAIDLTI